MEFDLEKQTIVDSLDVVPDDLKGLYTQKDGKFTIAENLNATAKAIVALQKASKASRSDVAKLKEQLAGLDLSELADFGKTPKEIKAAVQAKLDELQGEIAKGKDGKINIDKIKEDLAKGHAKETEKLTNRANALQAQLYELLVSNVATTAIVEEKGVPDLLMPFLKDKVKVIEEDGKFNVFVVDAAGDRRYSGTTGNPMTIKELVKEMKSNEKFARLFESQTNSGGGKNPGSSQQQTKTVQTNGQSSMDKIRSGLDKGQAKRGGE